MAGLYIPPPSLHFQLVLVFSKGHSDPQRTRARVSREVLCWVKVPELMQKRHLPTQAETTLTDPCSG